MRSKQPTQDTFDRHLAVVIGGSMAGLLAARVLSEHFEQVTIIERDTLTGEAEPRKGIPQGRHVHGLLVRGVGIMGKYFPDLFPTLAQGGAIPVSMGGVRWNQLGVWLAPVPGPVKILFQSRSFLEQHVRDQLAARDNVRIRDACEVSQLCTDNDRITGVVLRNRSGEQHEEVLFADLVVDTSGRGSRAPQWLHSLGYGNVQETSVKIDIGYATRIYRCPIQPPANWEALFIFGRPPDDKRGGVIFPTEGGYWMVTLVGSLRDYPPDDEARFLAFARSLAQPDLYEAIKDAEPVTPIALYKYTANRWRHFERMKRLPQGFIIMGDAVCSFNPVYGQGMSVAAVEAQTLDRCLREQELFAGKNSVAGFTQRFQQAIARDIKTPWLLSTGEDLRYPGAEGKRSLGIRLLNRYMRRVIELTASDSRMTASLLRVRNLLKPLSTLFQPRIILAVLRQELAAFRQQPTMTAPASEGSVLVSSSDESVHSKV
ncbi:MAG: FAD-dependent monooxygenase [Ktedonobacteraceae bacterium]|nr:FAD-dependent monooxygenase [Ktedonobacteraceae bacterium]